MSARRRRAAFSALGALAAALLCAVLASGVQTGWWRNLLIALALAWLVVTASCVVSLLRTENPAPVDPDEPT